jgi:O-antigen ligase
MGTAAIVSNSRSGVISLAASIVFMMVLKRGRGRFSRIGPIAVVALVMIAGVMWIGASGIVEHFGEAVDQLVHSGTPDVGRAMIWQGTLNMIRAHPILGVGLGAFVTIYPTYETMPSLLRINYAHNDYLQVLAEGGAVGGIIAVWFIAVILTGIYRGIGSRDPLSAGMSLAAGAGIIAVLIQSLSDTDLQVPSNALLFLVLVAVVSRTGERQSRNNWLAADCADYAEGENNESRWGPFTHGIRVAEHQRIAGAGQGRAGVRPVREWAR